MKTSATAYAATLAMLGSIAFIGSPPHASVRSANVQTVSADAALAAGVNRVYGELPLSFEANQGQAESRVDFVARGSGYTLLLKSTEAVLSLHGAGDWVSGRRSDGLSEATSPNGAVVKMQIVGSDPASLATGQQELGGKVNYVIGSDPTRWRLGIATYARVAYANVYPSIDLVYYGRQGQLEYDFVIAPGGDPRSIGLRFTDVGAIEIDAQGALVLRVHGDEIRQQRPLIYQDVSGVRTEISGGYSIRDANAIGFDLGSYDATRPLVIDPSLVYSTFLGGSATDAARAIAVDASGNAYVTGYTLSTDFPTTTGAFQPTFAGGYDAFVAKLTPTGSALIYSTYLGGSDREEGYGIAVDPAGNAYATGYTYSADFPSTPGAVQPSRTSVYSDAWVTKLGPTGSVRYSTYLGGSFDEHGLAIAADASGNAYVTGVTGSLDFPTTPGAYQPTANGGYDTFVAKLAADGSSLVYSTYVGGSAREEGNGIAVDVTGSVYVTGFTVSMDFPTAGALQATPGGGSDAYITKLNASLSTMLYSTYLGGAGDDLGQGIAVDGSGNAYVTGATHSNNFPATAGAAQASFGGGPSDAFAAKLSSSGASLNYSTYLGGDDNDVGQAIAIDALGSAYIAGSTVSLNFPTTIGAFQRFMAGSSDAFITRLNPSGSLGYSTYLGGGSGEGGAGIAVDGKGDAYVTGTAGAGLPTTPGTLQPTSSAGFHAFVAKLSVLGQPTAVTLTPATTTGVVGAQHCVLATVTDANGIGLADVIVRFGVSGSVTTAGSQLTDAAGEASFCYAGPTFPGADTITAYADTNGNNARETGEPIGTAAKTWVLPSSTPGCQIAFRPGKITADNGHKGTFGSAKVSSSSGGTLDYQDHTPSSGMQVPDMKVKSTEVLAVLCASDQKSATIYGTASINQSGSYYFRIDVTDGGDSAILDTYRIRLSTGYDSGAHNLESGNIKIG